MKGLKDKVTVITGGLGDLGYATGKRMVDEGCKVALFDIKDDENNAAKSIGCKFWQVDIGNEDQIKSACKAVESTLGKISILVNCAALFIFKSVDATPEELESITRVNIAGTSLVTKHAVPQMKSLGGGTIINFSSISGFIGQAEFATYNATKFAIRGFTRCWAQDLAPFNIRVNCICPGYIYTDAFENYCKTMDLDLEKENRRVSDLHLLGRQGKPGEVAGGVAFLASEDSSFITGSDLVVDGGYLAV